MHDNDRLIRRTEVEQRAGISTSTLYRAMRAGKFPEPYRVGPHAVRWSLAEIEQWRAALPRARGQRQAA